jgi:alanine-synthesizing transaminase
VIRYSARIPEGFEPNRIHRALTARRAAGAPLLDLTESNPTRVGLPGPPAEAWSALAAGARAPYAPEPLGLPAARQAVAGYYAERGSAVSSAQVALTASTSEAYAHLFRLLADPGGEFLVPEPSYPLFAPLAALEGVRLVPYPLRYRDGRWDADLLAIEALAGPAARGLIVVHPNNPTGSLTAERDALALEGLCADHGLALIADEVFGDFVLAPAAGRRGSFVTASQALTFVLAGLSKACGLPQAKLGWIVTAGPGPEVTRALARLEWAADAFLSVGAAIQAALPELLRRRGAFVAAARERLAVNLGALDGALSGLPGVDRLACEGGWSAVVRVPTTRSEEDWVCALLERDVAVHPGHFFDFAEEAYLVVSLLPEPEVFTEAAARLRAVLAA